MINLGSILIADDEEVFRESTCRLLQREGYECRSAKDADEALEILRGGRFDVLIADIRMPRNQELRIVKEARELDRQMPVVLVTGYPSIDTALRSVSLPVIAYLTKPVDFDELLQHVREAVGRSRQRRAVQAVAERLRSALTDLDSMAPSELPRLETGPQPVSRATIRTLASCLSQLLELAEDSGADWASPNLCELLECPQRPVHRQAILETIDVLRKTKDTFKSKALAQLRAKLEAIMHGEN